LNVFIKELIESGNPSRAQLRVGILQRPTVTYSRGSLYFWTLIFVVQNLLKASGPSRRKRDVLGCKVE
jgi:hypothetical protein